MPEAVPQQPEAKRFLDIEAKTLDGFFDEIGVDPDYLEDDFEPKLRNPDTSYLPGVKMPRPATGALFLPSRRLIQEKIGDEGEEEGLTTMKVEWEDDVYEEEYMLPGTEQLAELLYKHRLDARAKVRGLLTESLKAITYAGDGKSIVRPCDPILFGTSPFLTQDELEVGVSTLDRAMRPEDMDFNEALMHARLGLLPILWKTEQLAKRFSDPHFALNQLQRMTAPYRAKIAGATPEEESIIIQLPQIPWDRESQERQKRSLRNKIRRPPAVKLRETEKNPLRSEIIHARSMQMEFFDYQIRNQIIRNSRPKQFKQGEVQLLTTIDGIFLNASARCHLNSYFQERWLYQLRTALSTVRVFTQPVIEAIIAFKGQLDSAQNANQLLEALKQFIKAGLPIACATMVRVQKQPAVRPHIVEPPAGTVKLRDATRSPPVETPDSGEAGAGIPDSGIPQE